CVLYRPEEDPESCLALLDMLKKDFADRTRLAVARAYGPCDRHDIATAAALARSAGLPLMAVGDTLYHAPSRRPLQDVLAAIRLRVPVARAGRHLVAHAERHLKAPAEMLRLFAGQE